MTGREFNEFMREIDRRMEREKWEWERRKPYEDGRKNDPPTFPYDDRRPPIDGPPRLMRCG